MLERRHDLRRARVFYAILVFPLTGLLFPADPYAAERERMVREQIESRGIRGPELLRVLRATPRHLFVPVASRPMAEFILSTFVTAECKLKSNESNPYCSIPCHCKTAGQPRQSRPCLSERGCERRSWRE